MLLNRQTIMHLLYDEVRDQTMLAGGNAGGGMRCSDIFRKVSNKMSAEEAAQNTYEQWMRFLYRVRSDCQPPAPRQFREIHTCLEQYPDYLQYYPVISS